MAAEVQRLTDALHHERTVTAAATAAETSEDTVFDAQIPEPPEASPPPDAPPATAPAQKPAGEPQRDAVGREIEASLEELEDLLTATTPGSQSQR